MLESSFILVIIKEAKKLGYTIEIPNDDLANTILGLEIDGVRKQVTFKT